jgi:hypothetical protein
MKNKDSFGVFFLTAAAIAVFAVLLITCRGNPIEDEEDEVSTIEEVFGEDGVFADSFGGKNAGLWKTYGGAAPAMGMVTWFNGVGRDMKGVEWGEEGKLTNAGCYLPENLWNFYFLNGIALEDFEVEFDCEHMEKDSNDKNPNEFGVLLRAGAPGKGINDGDAYALMNNMGNAFFGSVNGSWTLGPQAGFLPIGSTPMAYEDIDKDFGSGKGNRDGIVKHWKIRVEGNEIRVWLGKDHSVCSGPPSIAMKDPYNKWKKGQFGFRARVPYEKKGVVVSNFEIRIIKK